MACVTVVTALLWEAVVEEEAASAEDEGEEEGSVDSPCRLSPPCCWAVAVVAVLVVPVSWVSQGGLEQTCLTPPAPAVVAVFVVPVSWVSQGGLEQTV